MNKFSNYIFRWELYYINQPTFNCVMHLNYNIFRQNFSFKSIVIWYFCAKVPFAIIPEKLDNSFFSRPTLSIYRQKLLNADSALNLNDWIFFQHFSNLIFDNFGNLILTQKLRKKVTWMELLEKCKVVLRSFLSQTSGVASFKHCQHSAVKNKQLKLFHYFH